MDVTSLIARLRHQLAGNFDPLKSQYLKRSRDAERMCIRNLRAISWYICRECKCGR